MGKITIGNASSASNNGGNTSAGDQGQEGTPDYKGEVRMTEYASQQSFASSHSGWRVARPVDPSTASAIAQKMITACNNPNIGYSYGGHQMWCYGHGYTNKVDTNTKCTCDCSELCCECVGEVTGHRFYRSSGEIINHLCSLKTGGKNIFYGAFSVGKKDLCNGDVVAHKGHALIVVKGNPRKGQPDEDPGTTSSVTYGPWMSGWGVTIFSANGDSGQPNAYGVANPSVNYHGTTAKDNKGFISVAAGKEWDFNTRFEIKELPGVIFQVDDRGKSSLFDGKKHLDIFTNDYNVEEYVKTSDGKEVGLLKFARKHTWGYNNDLHVRTVEGNTSGGGGGGGKTGDGINSPGYLEVPIEYKFIPRQEAPDSEDEHYEYFKNGHGKNKNGEYAWGRFCEICDTDQITLSKGAVRKWYSHTEDKYRRGVAPTLGAIMCFVSRNDASDDGFAVVVEVVHSDYICVSFKDNNGTFHYKKWSQKYNGTWNLDLEGSNDIGDTIFQGCIYPPNVDELTLTHSKLQKFLEIANKYLGTKIAASDFVHERTFANTNIQSWSTAFITGCARQTGGILGIIIPDVYGASSVGYVGVRDKMGEWQDGPALGGSCAPQVGDIALFRNDDKKRLDKYAADQAGIVISCTTKDKTSVDPNGKGFNRKYQFTVIMGDVNGLVQTKNYHNTSGSLSGIFRPYWQKVDGTSEVVKYALSPIGMYNEGTSIEDAAIRDVCYAEKDGKSKMKPSIKETGITISAINYTGMLSNMYSVLADIRASMDDEESVVPSIWDETAIAQYRLDVFATEPFPPVYPTRDSSSFSSESTFSSSKSSSSAELQLSADGTSVMTTKGKMVLNGNSKSIYRELYATLKNDAAVVGIMANMWQESGWSPGAVNKSDGGSGLIQWTDTFSKYGWSLRCTNMKKYVGANWATNITKQIEYLFVEAESNAHYKTGMGLIKKVENTSQGAYDAMKLFLRYFELGQGQWNSVLEATNLAIRGPFAAAAWKLFKGDAK